MASLEKISFRARATGSDLHLRVIFDGQEIFSQILSTDTIDITHEFNDLEGPHSLEIEMSGKTRRHTRLDPTGEIIEDRWIEISEFKISEIDLQYILSQVGTYEHDTNGTTEKIQEKFFGNMGCNGRVKLEFTSPIFLWVLENM